MDIYVARQPIFDRQKKVFAYELLYRKSTENYFRAEGADMASSSVILDSLHVIGLDVMTNGKKAFINFTDNLLKQDIATILPKNKVVIELLETIEPDEKIIDQCKNLKKLGYQLALDDFTNGHQYKPLLEIIDIIKVDFIQSSKKEIISMMNIIGRDRIKYLAEKVETLEEFNWAYEMGFSYFQGYFFSKPVIISAKDITPNKLNYMQLIVKINEEELEFGSIQEFIERDAALSYKLLRLVNSAAFGFRQRIESIRQALVILGIKEIRKWVSLIALKGISGEGNEAVLQLCLMRAKFAENLSNCFKIKKRSSELFLMGLFSMMDVLMNRPMEEILHGIPISESIKNALLGYESEFTEINMVILLYEKGNWELLLSLIDDLGVKEKDISTAYIKTMEWVNSITI